MPTAVFTRVGGRLTQREGFRVALQTFGEVGPGLSGAAPVVPSGILCPLQNVLISHIIFIKRYMLSSSGLAMVLGPGSHMSHRRHLLFG